MKVGRKSQEVREDMARRLSSDTFLANAVRAAVRAAVREHKQAGNPVVGWQDGHVVVITPENIQVPGDEGAEKI